MMAHVTGDWNPLGDVFYRKVELYNMQTPWQKKADIPKCKIAAAPFGGPIALMRDDRKSTNAPPARKPEIFIFSSSGKPISFFRWDSGQLLDFGWSSTEDLLCIQQDGTVLVYDILARFQGRFSMGQVSKDNEVIDSRIFFNPTSGTSGVAVLTGNYKFYVVSNVKYPQSKKMADVPGLVSPPSCWTVISKDRDTYIMLSKDRFLHVIDPGFCQDQALENTNGACIEMSLSFDNQRIALFTDRGDIHVFTSDLQRKLCEFNTNSQMRPKQLVWCGNGAVVAYWENFLLAIGMKKDWIKYNLDLDAYLVPEMDGLRILQPDIQEFLQEVPVNVANIFRVASMASGALLFEASREFQKKSQKADEYIRMIHDDLPNAVNQCLQAAGEEFEPNTQKSLLRAASFGRCFLTNSNPSQFEEMCQILRVRNAVGDFTVGIPLTLAQLKRLTVEVLIDRLIRRRQWELAMNISKYLKLSDSESRILTHWACYQVDLKKKSDDEIAASIKRKLGDAPSISYSEIAKKASEVSRNELAVKLLDYEPRASEQVPLLLTMKNTEAALRKSIESGDTDLVHTVLITLTKEMKMQEFLMTLTNYPEAQNLYIQYCRQENPQTLLDIHYQNDNFQEMAACHIRNSYEQSTLVKKQDYLRSAQENYTRARNEFAARCTDEQRKLLDCQQQIEEKHNVEFVGLSVHDTAHKLIVSGLPKLAESIRKDFRIPDKRFWFLKIDALAMKCDWLEIERFSKSKKSPIGYEPFVHVCMKYNMNFEAKKYLTRVAPEKRAKVHMLLGLYDDAADIAFQQKNEDDLNQILRVCSSNRELVAKIHSMKAQLGRR